ncbi:MAG: RidA family protein [Chloroflexota bacterium]
MKQVIQTDHAPAAVGPYSQAIKLNNLIFTAGQIGLDPATGKIVDGGIEAQTRQVMSNLEAVLKEAGVGMDAIVKTTIFLTDLGNFGTVNGIYGEYFADAPPARSTVEVAGLPLGAIVEVEAIAILGA